ncbi:S8 family serine peptidase [Cohnella sp. CFH 77786]|uniref:S8 family peptidase n=1 Tax=Cohnella sp. CFH 77786 TaxID=2662265 RepID=UPI001C60C5E0|nr:S8 family peptidase [Cohnella sp. CFH 77786]MBW5446266.1 S8 family serine peptidase [Cohnella sp. CFH 77786]
MKRNVRVIPFEVLEERDNVHEVPKGVELVQAPAIWEQTMGKGVTVAVLDTGCDISHPDLRDRIRGGINFTDDDGGNAERYMDYNGHGTHVAGTIAASRNDSGVVGVAPEADLLVVKVLDRYGSGQYDWIIRGIHYAIEQKADIISMSLGGPEDVPELHAAIRKAVESGIVVVCAAGNEGDGNESTNEFDYPGSYNEVVSVGAIDLNRRSADFSNSNNEIDLVAPGEQILSTFPGGKYATLSGTSMATPHVAGAVALIKVLANRSFERNLTEHELYAQLIRRTVPLGTSPKLEGNGLVYLTLLDRLSHLFDAEFAAKVLRVS